METFNVNYYFLGILSKPGILSTTPNRGMIRDPNYSMHEGYGKPFRGANQHTGANQHPSTNFDVHSYAKQQPDYGYQKAPAYSSTSKLQQSNNDPASAAINDAVAEEEARNQEFFLQQGQSLVFPQRQKQQQRISLSGIFIIFLKLNKFTLLLIIINYAAFQIRLILEGLRSARFLKNRFFSDLLSVYNYSGTSLKN